MLLRGRVVDEELRRLRVGKAMMLSLLLAGLLEGDGAVRVAPDGENENGAGAAHRR